MRTFAFQIDLGNDIKAMATKTANICMTEVNFS